MSKYTRLPICFPDCLYPLLNLTKASFTLNYSKICSGTYQVVQWLRYCASNAGGAGSIPDQGTKIPRALGQLNSHTTTETERRNSESLHCNDVSVDILSSYCVLCTVLGIQEMLKPRKSGLCFHGYHRETFG